MAEKEPQAAAFHETIGAQLTQNSKFHLNLAQDVIVTTEDRLRLCLHDHLDRLVNKQGWIAPVSLFVTLLIVFPTTEFKPFILPAPTWQAIFVLAAAAAFIWSARAVWKALMSDTKIDTLVDQIKTASQGLKVPPAE